MTTMNGDRDEHSGDGYLLLARTSNVSNIVKVLQAVNFREYATFLITETSIRVVAEEMQCLQSNAYINADTFYEYHVKDNNHSAAFKVNLSHVVTCLKVHSKNSCSSNLKLSYRGEGFPLELILEENGVITDCNLKTFPPDDLVQFSMDGDHNRITMTCELMKMMLREIDPTSDIVEIGLAPTSPNLCIVTAGAGGEGTLEMDQGEGTFRSFECPLILKSSFKLSHLKMAFKPLNVFQIFCMRIDENGLLRLQYKTDTANMRYMLAEFYTMPLLDNE